MKKNESSEQNIDQPQPSNEEASKQTPVPSIAVVKNYLDQEEQRIALFQEKRKKPRPPSLNYIKEDDKMEFIETIRGFACVGLSESFGTVNLPLQEMLLDQVTGVSPRQLDRKVRDVNASLAFLHGIKPKDELEGLLVAQMIGTHNLAMEFMRRAMAPDQCEAAVASNTERATKMLRTFTTQMEALNRHRAKEQHKVTVGNVTVNSGGQAIVGQVSHPNSSDDDGKGQKT